MRRRTLFKKKPYKRTSILKRARAGKVGKKYNSWYIGPRNGSGIANKGILHVHNVVSSSAGCTIADGPRPWAATVLTPDTFGYTSNGSFPLTAIGADPAHWTQQYRYTKGAGLLFGQFEWMRAVRATLRVRLTTALTTPTRFGIWVGRNDRAHPDTYLKCKNDPQYQEWNVPGNQLGRTVTVSKVIDFAKALGLTPTQWNADEGTWYEDHTGVPTATAQVKAVIYFGTPDIAINPGPVTLFHNILVSLHQVFQCTGAGPYTDPLALEHENEELTMDELEAMPLDAAAPAPKTNPAEGGDVVLSDPVVANH